MLRFGFLLALFWTQTVLGIVNLAPVNGSHVYEDQILFEAVGVPLGEKTIIRFSNHTESLKYDLDITKYLDPSGKISLEILVSGIRGYIPSETDIYWQVISGNGAVQSKGQRWFVRITDILRPFSLLSPQDYSLGGQVMTFSWESQPGIEYYEIYFSTLSGFSFSQRVFTNSLTLPTHNFPREQYISWRVKAFRDGGQNNIWSREWWNFKISGATDVHDASIPEIEIKIFGETLQLQCFSSDPVEVSLWTLNGALVKQLFSGSLEMGVSIPWHDLPCGMYFLRIVSPRGVFSQKILK